MALIPENRIIKSSYCLNKTYVGDIRCDAGRVLYICTGNRWFIIYGKIAVIRKLSRYIRVPRAIELFGAFGFRGIVLGF